MTVYLDCAATTPVEPGVLEELIHYTEREFGNAGSRTHEFGANAKKRVQKAREQVGNVVGAEGREVVFTSGATEANNIALLGLAQYGEDTGKKHIVSSAVEHKAILEPLQWLAGNGFDIELLDPDASGAVSPDTLAARLRPDTLCVSIMQVNNETGVAQPIDAIADVLDGHDAYLHSDAAQGYGKHAGGLGHPRVDLVSVSGHKIYAPKGVGALIARRRDGRQAPLEPIMFGGGQERGLRPGTLPVGLIAALGTAAELAVADREEREARNRQLRNGAVAAVRNLNAAFNGDPELMLPTTLNFSVPGLDSEAAIVALKGTAAISNGSACTSQSYSPSHVLEAMGLPADRQAGALRISWCHMTPDPDWSAIESALRKFAT